MGSGLLPNPSLPSLPAGMCHGPHPMGLLPLLKRGVPSPPQQAFFQRTLEMLLLSMGGCSRR